MTTKRPPISLAQLKKQTSDKPLYTKEQLKQSDDHIGIIQLISGTNGQGEDFYAYVSFRPSHYEEFLRKTVDKERVNVESYGKVLQKGFGKNPSDDVKKYMEEKFGIDHDFMQHFSKELERLQHSRKTDD